MYSWVDVSVFLSIKYICIFLCAHMVVRLFSISVEHKTIKTFFVNQCKISLPDLDNIQWNLNSVATCLTSVLFSILVSKKLVHIQWGIITFSSMDCILLSRPYPRAPKHGVQSNQTQGKAYQFTYKYTFFFNGISGQWNQYGVQQET